MFLYPGKPKRLPRVWINDPAYLITTVTAERKPLLANAQVHQILVEEWQGAYSHYRWAVGDYVIMPDHVHFVCYPYEASARSLSVFLQQWKQWTAKRLSRQRLWQPGFHDRLLRSQKEWEEACTYMYLNPVRAGLVTTVEDWPYQGHLNAL